MPATLTDHRVIDLLLEVMAEIKDEIFYDDSAKDLLLVKLEYILQHLKTYCVDI